ncbi:MAG TPA: PhoU domain-containing protein [Planctomycetota bacterium]|nr:PhoU domain-containing protein [Planctomycetota bacterium]
MTHYEERLQKDLGWIHELVGIVGAAITKAIDDAVSSVLNLDKGLAALTVIGDYTINRQTRELDRLCHAFVARHLPSAGHLRYVSAVLRLNIALERIGDYAATIGRTAAQLSAVPPAVVARDIEMMSEHARRMLNDSLRSFQQRDVHLAQATLTSAAQFAQYFDRVFADLVKEGETHSRPINDLFSLMATFNRLERVIHQAKNICEETTFVATGKTKGEKVFNILFVDAANSGPSQLAEHFTRKAFPQSGLYRSAGWEPAEDIEPAYQRFAETVGIDLAKAWPSPLSALLDQLDDYHLVIGLAPDARERIGKVPFHTTVLLWDVDATSGPEAVYRQLTPRVRELMERLRGEQAS